MTGKKSIAKQHNPIATTPTRAYTFTYQITDEPIQDRHYKRLPQAVKDTLEKMFYEVQKKPEQAIPKLLELKRKYPQIPQIYNYLAVAYMAVGEMKKAEKITNENIRKHPDYLFARLNHAQLYLRKKEYEKIPIIFDHKVDLQALYPHRKQFHILEVANFMGIMGFYFLETNQREIAEQYNDFLQEVAAGYPIARGLNRALHPHFLLRICKRLAGK